MDTIIINTTIGTAKVKKIRGAVKIVTGGIWPGGTIDVVQYTDENERAGVLSRHNIPENKTTWHRIKCRYMSAESVKKYGRQVITEILPIYI